ncbi:unnamed protein product [Miscanthus lutarioriparius]|uniref:Uncharacterized protein n=1 Tax=Miscanthus lutarioriparius TaxID=422564 RepID=A0A811RVV8_9POAL|nr:unnamed protein product [Miscanthus lutarioriparius]
MKDVAEGGERAPSQGVWCQTRRPLEPAWTLLPPTASSTYHMSGVIYHGRGAGAGRTAGTSRWTRRDHHCQLRQRRPWTACADPWLLESLATAPFLIQARVGCGSDGDGGRGQCGERERPRAVGQDRRRRAKDTASSGKRRSRGTVGSAAKEEVLGRGLRNEVLRATSSGSDGASGTRCSDAGSARRFSAVLVRALRDWRSSRAGAGMEEEQGPSVVISVEEEESGASEASGEEQGARAGGEENGERCLAKPVSRRTSDLGV